jgi:predicted alpha/beta superfamily hydrolase
MKPQYLFFIWSIVLITVSCTNKKDNRITIGKTDSLYSDVLKEQRKVLVYVPTSYEHSDTSRHYPVMYLLDGESHFHSVTGVLDRLTENDICPEMIVIAIPNTDRSRDLTPTHSTRLPTGESEDFLKTTGGGEQFTRFIETELIPYVQKHYRTAPYRVLVGHSFGGLLTINTLINHPDLFDSYLAIDPSLWWDNRKLLLHSDTVLRQKKFNRKTLFVSVANTMTPEMDTLRVNADTTGNTVHIRSIIRFAKNVQLNKSRNGLNFAWKYYPDDDHGSVPLISEYDGLRFMFGYYKFRPDADVMALQLTDHYKMVSEKLGYAMLPPESKVNDAGYYFLRLKKFDQAFSFFDLNIKNFPHSANVYSSMGDYYVAVDDKPKAIEFFEKSLAIQDSEDTRTKLNDLKKAQK